MYAKVKFEAMISFSINPFLYQIPVNGLHCEPFTNHWITVHQIRYTGQRVAVEQELWINSKKKMLFSPKKPDNLLSYKE
jgi:hypothetical protein